MGDRRKNALVVGGCRGIGKGIALRLAADGFDIVATARAENENSAAVKREVEALGREFRLMLFDVRDAGAVLAEYKRVFGDTGAPDALIYNAGIARDNLFMFMSADEWHSVIETSVNGFFNTVQPLVFNMLARKSGRIVVISSVSGVAGQAGQANYSAGKAALIGAAKSLAREVGRKGVLVNVVAPGIIDTEMTANLPLERILPLVPLNRVGKVEEVAGVVSFRCGGDSSYVHGQVIGVNGGLLI